jgi:hypothetical protein
MQECIIAVGGFITSFKRRDGIARWAYAFGNELMRWMRWMRFDRNDEQDLQRGIIAI